MPKGKKPHPKTTEALIAYNKNRSVDWDNVDWTLNNRALSQLLNRSYDTVAKKRYLLKKTGLAKRAPARYLKGYYPQLAHADSASQKRATQSAQNSLIAGRFETNCHAKKWRLTAPDGTVYECTNLYHFVRNHTHLFAPDDVIFKRQNSKRGAGGEYCNATAGLQNASRTGRGWKKWQAQQI